MLYEEVLDTLQNLIGYKPPAKVIAQVLGMKSSKTLYTRSQRHSDFSDAEVKKLIDYFAPSAHLNTNTLSDKVEIPYYRNPNLTTNIKTQAVTSIWFDRELVENIWRMNPANLRITTMLGDKMDSGSYPLHKDDLLIMDISDKDVTKAGVYAFTTHNDTFMFINGVNRRFDGTYRFYFYNTNYPEKVLTDEDVKKADIKIVGRIVKNLSLTI